MQTKASSISKSLLISLEWVTKQDRMLLLDSGVGTTHLYDTEAKKNLCEININDDMFRILSLMCRPNGTSFVCSAAAFQFSLDPEPITINCTAFNHNGNMLVTGAADGVIWLFGMQVCSR
ncbi:WD repeat-containing protein 91 [Sciurus carolinensis]|uniref:WD repeat-containing protein 91 n=1 Tax=Sciurus carolinensis TaxID=30640 RepID=A0AA41MJ80_SCICA|nr:WD repeat-containing protein 91 [Sciurus carolinensis]